MWRTTTFSGHLTLSSLRTTFRLGGPMEEDVRGNGRNSINAFSDTIQSKSKRQEEKVVALFCLVRLRRTVTPPRKVSRAGRPCDSKSRRSHAAFSCGFAIFLLPWQRCVMSQFPLQAIRSTTVVGSILRAMDPARLLW